MHRRLIDLGIMLAVLGAAATSIGAVPTSINVQGRLTIRS